MKEGWAQHEHDHYTIYTIIATSYGHPLLSCACDINEAQRVCRLQHWYAHYVTSYSRCLFYRLLKDYRNTEMPRRVQGAEGWDINWIQSRFPTINDSVPPKFLRPYVKSTHSIILHFHFYIILCFGDKTQKSKLCFHSNRIRQFPI